MPKPKNPTNIYESQAKALEALALSSHTHVCPILNVEHVDFSLLGNITVGEKYKDVEQNP